MYWKDGIDTLMSTYLQHNRIGLITDVDGTISPIVDQPDQAQVTPRNLELLKKLQRQLAFVGVISGRAATDVAQRVGIPELIYVGNHGLEQWQNGNLTLLPQVAQYRSSLESAINDLKTHQVDGLFIEDKQATLSVHYRNVSNPSDFESNFETIANQIATSHNLRCFHGRMVFEFRPPLDMNKGTAFRDLVQSNNLDSALYIGDDTTDVDALKMARQLRQSGNCYALAIGVDSDDAPASVRDNADLVVSGVSGVEELLDWIACNASSS